MALQTIPSPSIDADELTRRIVDLCRGGSVEMSAREIGHVAEAREHLAPGTRVAVTWLPKEDVASRAAAATAVHKAGLEPVPHLAARHIESAAELDEYLTRLTNEAGVTRVFVIGGDRDKARGPFENAEQVLASGALQRAGIQEAGIACYPEGHAQIPDAVLDQALKAKVKVVEDAGLRLFLASQFCFDAEPILDHVAELRKVAPEATVRVGLAGPAKLSSLIKFAANCGIGASARALVTRGAAFSKLLTDAGPDPIIRDLMASPRLAALEPVSLHLFAFGGLVRTARWLGAVANGRFRLDAKGDGFHVDLPG